MNMFSHIAWSIWATTKVKIQINLFDFFGKHAGIVTSHCLTCASDHSHSDSLPLQTNIINSYTKYLRFYKKVVHKKMSSYFNAHTCITTFSIRTLRILNYHLVVETPNQIHQFYGTHAYELKLIWDALRLYIISIYWLEKMLTTPLTPSVHVTLRMCNCSLHKMGNHTAHYVKWAVI